MVLNKCPLGSTTSWLKPLDHMIPGDALFEQYSAMAQTPQSIECLYATL